MRNLSRETVIEQLRFLRIFPAPRIVSFFPAIIFGEQCFLVLGEIVIYLLRHEIMLFWQAERLTIRIDKLGARFAMRLVSAFDFWNTFSDERMRDDDLRFAVVAPFRDVERVEKLSHVLAVDLLYIEPVGLHPLSSVFALRLFCRSVQRHGIGIVDENQIIEAPMPANAHASEATPSCMSPSPHKQTTC